MNEGFVTRWPVLREHPVTARNLDSNGDVSDEALEPKANLRANFESASHV